jgi:hypothetical protein
LVTRRGSCILENIAISSQIDILVSKCERRAKRLDTLLFFVALALYVCETIVNQLLVPFSAKELFRNRYQWIWLTSSSLWQQPAAFEVP